VSATRSRVGGCGGGSIWPPPPIVEARSPTPPGKAGAACVCPPGEGVAAPQPFFLGGTCPVYVLTRATHATCAGGGTAWQALASGGVSADRSVLRSPPSVGTRVHADRDRRRMRGARGPVGVAGAAANPSVSAASAQFRPSPAPPAACAGGWGAWGADLVGRGLSPTLSFAGCRTVLARAGVPAVSCPP